MKHLSIVMLVAAAIAAATIAVGTRSAPPAGASSATTPAVVQLVHVPTRGECRRLFAHDEPRDLGPCLAGADR